METAEITEEMMQFVSENPRVMRRWQNMAHQAGMSARVPVIQARIRMEGRDHDEHVVELIRVGWVSIFPVAVNYINFLTIGMVREKSGRSHGIGSSQTVAVAEFQRHRGKN